MPRVPAQDVAHPDRDPHAPGRGPRPASAPRHADPDAGLHAAGWVRLGGGLAAWTRGSGRRVVFLHGFTQTCASWRPIAEPLSDAGYECVLVDLPGHGQSAAVRADLRSGADLIAGYGPAVIVGYSMGGRFALHVAFAHPSSTRALAVIGATLGIDDEHERAARRAADDHLATHITTVGVAEFLVSWTGQALFDGYRPTETDHAARLTNTPDGLAGSLRLAGTGSQLSLWRRLHELTMPVLAMAGERDAKFAAIAAQIGRDAPNGRTVLIPGAAHAAHLEQPTFVRDALAQWLASIGR